MSSCYLFTANLITLLPLILCRTQPTLSTKQKRQLQEKLEYVQEVVKTKKVVCMCADRDALIRYQFAATLSLSKEICTGARSEKSWIFASLCDCFCWHEVDYFGILMVDSLPVEKAVWRLPTPERQRSRHGLVETHACRYPHCHEGLDDHFSKIPHQPPCSADLLVVNHPSSGAVNCKATLPIRWCYLC